MAATQANRHVSVTSPLGADVLLFHRMTGTEQLGRLFEYEVELLSTNGAVPFKDVLGQPMTVAVDLAAAGAKRYFSGIVARFRAAGRLGEFHRYHASLRPWLWLLTRTSDCRIFQKKMATDIVKEVFRDGGFSDFDDSSLSGTYREWEYCVQYRETDFNFVSRLMEQEGFYYYFKHEDGKHTLWLSDSVSSHGPAPGHAEIPYYPPDDHRHRDKDHINEWLVQQEIQPGSFVHDDFDFENPKGELQATNTVGREHAESDYEMYDYPGEYVVSGDGTAYASRRLEEFQAQHERIEAAGNVRALFTGALFTLTGYEREDQEREYLVTGATYEVTSNEYVTGAGGRGEDLFRCRITAIPSQQQFRAASVTRKPVVQGPQTAVVVGPSGKEIWTDKYGRIKVQFHWDRLGQNNEESSCWIRVAQVWAGKTWGGIHIPRIGQEVIVDFLEGDPDRPIITGRVYNADQMPPYALPDNATQSGLKSRSSAEGTVETFNELRFEDKKDSEQVYFHAEKNFDRVVENNDTLKIGFEKKDKGDRTVEVFNNQTVKVGTKDGESSSETYEVFNNQTVKVGSGEGDAADGSQTITVWKNRTETVKEGDEAVTIEKGNRTITVSKGNDTHTVSKGNREVTVSEGNDAHTVSKGNREVTISQGNDTLTITQGNQTIKLSAGKSTLEAGQAIELKVGANSIKIDAAGITIKATQVAVEGTAKVEVKGPIVQANGDGMLQLKGGMVKLN